MTTAKTRTRRRMTPVKNNDGEHSERCEDKKTGTMRETGRQQQRDNKDRDQDQTRTTGTISINEH